MSARHLTVWLRALVATSVLVATAACGTETEGHDPTRTLVIESPEDGDEVTAPVTVTVSSNVDLDDGDEGFAVRYFVDGLEGGSASGAMFRIDAIDPGPHSIHVSLVGPDGEPAGAEDEVTVSVTANS